MDFAKFNLGSGSYKEKQRRLSDVVSGLINDDKQLRQAKQIISFDSKIDSLVRQHTHLHFLPTLFPAAYLPFPGG